MWKKLSIIIASIGLLFVVSCTPEETQLFKTLSKGDQDSVVEFLSSRSTPVAVDAARSQLGTPYVWGGTSTSGFDCSGFIQWAWRQAGVDIPRTSGAQGSFTKSISSAELQPGDLVFSGSPIYHVAMYIGDGQVIHSPRSGDVVKIVPMSHLKPSSFGRIK